MQIAGQPSRRQRWRYTFDEQMSKGPASIFAALIVTFVCLLFTLALARVLVVVLLRPDIERGSGPLRQVFLTFLELTDPGSMTQDIDSAPVVKALTVATGLLGVVLFSSVIAFITTAVDSRLAQLRKGRSLVVEEDHTLILGWNDRVVEILAELIIANESEPNPVVVIMADREKELMDDFLSFHFASFANTKVVTRAGSPSALLNLQTVAVTSAKSVIILAQCNAGSSDFDKAASDMGVVKATLAVTSSLPHGSDVPVVVELFDGEQRNLAASIDPQTVICMNTDEILAKIIVQTSRSSGLSVVYDEVLSFDGAELYLFEHEWADHETFGSVAFQLADGVPIGMIEIDGTIRLNPDPQSALAAGSSLVVLASDDSALQLVSPRADVPTPPTPIGRTSEIGPETQLVIGLNSKLATILDEYADYVAEGSAIDIIPRNRERVFEQDSTTSGSGQSLTVNQLDVDPFDFDQLRAIELDRYANVILLSEGNGEVSEEWIDSETLIVLLQLQRLLSQIPNSSRPKLIAEILGSDSRDLVTRTGVKEFVISNRMISMLVAQISENRELEKVYEDLFAEDGSEVYLKGASLYFDSLPASVPFSQIMATAQARGEVAIGVKKADLETDAEQNFGVRLIPDKAAVLEISAADTLIVVAEDET